MKAGPDDEALAGIREKLRHESIQSNLIRASLFLAAFELLKASVLDAPETILREPTNEDLDAFNKTIKDGKFRPSKRYRETVRPLDKHPLKAALKWLVSQNVLTTEEMIEVDGLYRLRCDIAHDLPNYLVNIKKEFSLDHVARIQIILKTIKSWEFELEWPDKDVSKSRSMVEVLLDHLIQASMSA
jgi:hypothetical protein